MPLSEDETFAELEQQFLRMKANNRQLQAALNALQKKVPLRPLHINATTSCQSISGSPKQLSPSALGLHLESTLNDLRAPAFPLEMQVGACASGWA